jgi:secretion/DNA translocation related TadE-like protein
VTREEGAGTVLALAVAAAVVACALVLTAVGVVLDARRRAAAGADAAALAAADTVLGNTTGLPCVRAEDVAALAGVAVDACERSGELVRVTTSVAVLGVVVRSVAVAGPLEAGR